MSPPVNREPKVRAKRHWVRTLGRTVVTAEASDKYKFLNTRFAFPEAMTTRL